MNKLQTNYNGKMPFELDDLRWMDDAYREAFYGFASAFGITEADSFKLSGCEVTISVNGNNNDYICTSGYIYFKGEVLKVNEHTVSIPNNPENDMVVFDVDVSYDPDGLDVFEDNSSHDTYEIRLGKMKAVNLVQPSTYMNYDAPTIHEIIVNKIKALSDSWRNIDSPGNPSFITGWGNAQGYEVVSFKKDAFGTVTIKGVATNVTPTGTIFKLPIGYLPSFDRYFACYLGTSVTIITIYAATGEVAVQGANTNQLIDLSSITFKI